MVVRRAPQSRKMKVTDLTPAEYNPRRISEEAMKGRGGLRVKILTDGILRPSRSAATAEAEA